MNKDIPNAHIWFYVCCTLLLLEVIIYFLSGNDFIFSVWGDRALFRTSELSEIFQVAGAELNHGGRTPGGFMYYFLYPITVFGQTPEAVFLILMFIFVMLVGWLSWTVSQTFGALAGLITAIVMLANATVYELQGQLWNPGISMIIGLPGIIIFFRALVSKDSRFIPIAIGFYALAAQAHVSWIMPIMGTVIVLLYARIPIRVSTILWSLAVVLVCYSPYLYHELNNGFEHTDRIAEYSHIASRKLGFFYHLDSPKHAIIHFVLSPLRTAFGLLSNVAMENFDTRPLYSIAVFLLTGFASMIALLSFLIPKNDSSATTLNHFGVSSRTVSKSLLLFIFLNRCWSCSLVLLRSTGTFILSHHAGPYWQALPSRWFFNTSELSFQRP